MVDKMIWLSLLSFAIINKSSGLATNSTRSRAAGYNVLRARAPVAAHGQRIAMMNSLDFNPLLLGGSRGYPGIRVRANAAMFRYASVKAANILTQQIARAQIPDINQCVAQVNGCVRVYGIRIVRYQCPQFVSIYPFPNDRIRISVQNLAMKIMGHLGGQINVLIPLRLFGIICMDASQISVEVEFEMMRNNFGALSVQVTGCMANIGHVNVYVLNGGIIGWAINAFFRSMVTQQIKKMVPDKVCGMLPEIVNNMINPKLAGIPHEISIAQVSPMLKSALSSLTQAPAQCNSPMCQRMAAGLPSPTPAPPPVPSPTMSQNLAPPPVPSASVSLAAGASSAAITGNAVQQSYKQNPLKRYNYKQRYNYSMKRVNSARTRTVAIRGKRAIKKGPCAGCPTASEKEMSQVLLRSLDLRKIADIALSVQIMGAVATMNDFTIDISGEFSPRGWGGTPFGPFPLYFPTAVGHRMIEAVVSDFTINSLLFWMHRRGFFKIRIGPEISAFSKLLSTTCGDDYDYSEENTSEESPKKMRHRILRLLRRSKRQSLTDLDTLGVCIGDIAPAIAEKYPDKKLYFVVRTARAPSIILSARTGVATVQLIADATMFLDGTTTRVGNLRITVLLDLSLRIAGYTLSGTANLRTLNVTDTEKSLGVSQGALNGIVSIAKGAVGKELNSTLVKGMNLPLRSLPIPVNLYNVQIGIIEHGIYLATDLELSLSALAGMPLGDEAAACYP